MLLPGKPGYADECPTCLHEKTRPEPPSDPVAKFLKRHPERRKALDALRRTLRQELPKFGIEASNVDTVIADFLIRFGTVK